MKLIWLPLEPLEQRYTEQWKRWFPVEFHKNYIDYIEINGTKLTDKIEKGSVLDCYGTNYWKMTQMANLISFLHNNPGESYVLLFADLWYPGIEALQYIKNSDSNSKIIISGILHAGSWDPNDFTVRLGMKSWAHSLESSWMNIYDMIFVATEYHKNLILKDHLVNSKIKVTGLPFYPDEIRKDRQGFMENKHNLIVFPHRLDNEKQPEVFSDLMGEIKNNRDFNPNFSYWSGLMTSEMNLTKTKFYDKLALSKISISCALQETFGYSMLESVALECIPIVPNSLSYSEMYPKELKYETQLGLKNKIFNILQNYGYYMHLKNISENLRIEQYKYTDSIYNMLNELKIYLK